MTTTSTTPATAMSVFDLPELRAEIFDVIRKEQEARGPQPPIDAKPDEMKLKDWEIARPFLDFKGYELCTIRNLTEDDAIEEVTEEETREEAEAEDDQREAINENDDLGSMHRLYPLDVHLPPQTEQFEPLYWYNPYNSNAVFHVRRKSDRKFLLVKCMQIPSPKYDLLKFIASEKNPSNPSVPVIEILEYRRNKAFIVMPSLEISWWYPPPSRVEGFMDTVRQFLEAVAYFHARNIALRDPTILTDGGDIDELKCRYYFTLSDAVRVENGQKLPPCKARSRRPKEESQGDFDPLPVDVYVIAETIENHQDNMNVKCLRLTTLLDDMRKELPRDRPTIDQALARFRRIRAEMSTADLEAEIDA